MTGTGAKKGNYRIQGTALIVEVAKKPFYFPMGLVESVIRKQAGAIVGYA